MTLFSPYSPPSRQVNLLWATALGDAHGLVAEGLLPARIARRYPHGLPVYGVLPSCRLISDDTEHAALTAHAWANAHGNPGLFGQLLGKNLKRWLWCLPSTTGMATARALVRLSVGVPLHECGVNSAGNGPCMRAPILGVSIQDPRLLKECIKQSTLITHTHPWAIDGALVIATTAFLALEMGRVPSWEAICDLGCGHVSKELRDVLIRASQSAKQGHTTQQFVEQEGWAHGPQGFVLHTVPAVLHLLWSHEGDWESVVRQAVLLGGDTDSIAALVGALAHLDMTRGDLPPAWLTGMNRGLWSLLFLDELERAARLGETFRHLTTHLPMGFWPRQALRNACITPLVLAHGVGRLFSPC